MEDHIFAYYRDDEENGQKILVAGNYGKEAHTIDIKGDVKKVLLSNCGREEMIAKEIREKKQLILDSCESVAILI